MEKLHKISVEFSFDWTIEIHSLFFIAIMFSQLKVPPMVFREWMLSCDSEYLKDDFLKQLEKYLPTSEELKGLAEFKNEIYDLQYSEQYFCAVSFARTNISMIDHAFV